jgi:hypothetical protein
MPAYDFHAAQEFGWAVLTAAGLAVAQILTSTDPSTITDWRTYGIALAGAAIRAGSGAVLDWAKNHQPAPRLSAEDIRAIVAEELARQQAPQIITGTGMER